MTLRAHKDDELTDQLLGRAILGDPEGSLEIFRRTECTALKELPSTSQDARVRRELRRWLRTVIPGSNPKRTYADMIARSTLERAVLGTPRELQRAVEIVRVIVGAVRNSPGRPCKRV
jgi:hypothetical protein